MKFFTTLLLFFALLPGCDDFIVPDGRTVTHGIVIDEYTEEPIEGIKLEIEKCNQAILMGEHCYPTVLHDFTSSKGLFLIEFGDEPKSNFILSIPFEMRDRIVIPEEYQSERNYPDKIKEGEMNTYLIRVKKYRHLILDLSTGASYDSLTAWYGISSHAFRFNAPLDTVIKFKGLPLTNQELKIRLWSGGNLIQADSAMISLPVTDSTYIIRNFP